MEILILVGLFGAGAVVLLRKKMKSQVLSPAVTNYGVNGADANSGKKLTAPKSLAPLGTNAFRVPPNRIAATPATAKPRPIQTTKVVAPVKGTMTRPVITSRGPVFAPTVREATAAKSFRAVTSPPTFKPAAAPAHPTLRTGTRAAATLHPTARLGQVSAMHPEQDGAAHPLAGTHGYTMHPAHTPSGQRTIARNQPR